MSPRTTGGAAPLRAVPLRSGCCEFPDCEEGPVTSTGMCESHRLVSVSSTGSWLEAG